MLTHATHADEMPDDCVDYPRRNKGKFAENYDFAAWTTLFTSRSSQQ